MELTDAEIEILFWTLDLHADELNGEESTLWEKLQNYLTEKERI